MTSIAGVNPGTYAYDADGNMTNRNGTVIAWNSDNLPISITQSSSNASSFSYAPDKHRYYQSAVSNGVTETTVYAGAFEVWTQAGVTKYRYHLSADGREVAQINLFNSGSTVTERVSYVLSDHLGSVDVVQSINASNGTIIGTWYMSFSAWGGRREPNTWLPPVGAAETQADHAADRYGFTHQEMLDNVGIVHMNGRIYDPNLGRFLSVDPVFEFPTNTQSLNPYSYVLNNPLSLTDPSGYTAACKDTSATQPGSGMCSVTVGDKTTYVSYSVSSKGVRLDTGDAMHAAALMQGGNGQENSNKGPGSALGNTVSQGGAMSQTTAGNMAQVNNVTGSQTQTGQANAVSEGDISNKVDVNPWLKQYIQVNATGTQLSADIPVIPGHGVTNKDLTEAETDIVGTLDRTYRDRDKPELSVDIRFHTVKEGGDNVLHILMCPPRVCHALHSGGRIGGDSYEPSNWIRIDFHHYSSYTPTHEFLHALGMHHQPSGSGSIMSPDRLRRVRYIDAERLIDAYRPY